MAITFNVSNPRVVSLEEFIDHVESTVDLRDLDSVCTAAPMLRGLANDRDLVVRQINRQVKNMFRSQTVASTQVLFLGEGHEFYVRANFWPSTADLSAGRVLQDQFAYHLAHDHNYNFMTVGYHGPGYSTDIYEYDNRTLEGYVGEPVDLRLTERVHFKTGMVMLYQASKDVHTQMPPDDLSITLNFMVSTPEVRLKDQYFFDLDQGVLIDYPLDLDGSRRVSMVKIAAHVGDGNTQQLLHDLSRAHPCRRTRLAAFESLAHLDPASQTEIWETACRDREELVSRAARKALA